MCLYVDNKLLWGRSLSHSLPQTSLLLQMMAFLSIFFQRISMKLLILFCNFIFGVPVTMVVMCVLLEDAQITQLTFHVIVKAFQASIKLFSKNCTTLQNSCLAIKAYSGSHF